MLKVNIRRRPLSDHSLDKEKTFEGSLFVGRVHVDDTKYLRLKFATGADKNTSIFEGVITPTQFAVVVEMMMEADPEAAIHAMGTALQTAQVQRRINEAAADEAA